jgi:hypothetical protein
MTGQGNKFWAAGFCTLCYELELELRTGGKQIQCCSQASSCSPEHFVLLLPLEAITVTANLTMGVGI